MRIIFMGNPTFAVPSLSILMDSGYQIVGVVTNPDKEQGRGRAVRPTPVASFATDRGLPLIQVDQLEDPGVISSLEEMKPDLFAVVAFRILPAAWLRIPKLSSINLHGSLLPSYRGAAPIRWALINGDSITGLTTFVLAPQVDTGDIIMKTRVVILPDDTYGSLLRRMSLVGARVLLNTLRQLESGTAKPYIQNPSEATKAPKIKPSHQIITWENHARRVHNLIRALSPLPGAYTFLREKRLKILGSMLSLKSGPPGEIIEAGRGTIAVGCGWGSIDVFEVQLEGKRSMNADEFLSGMPLKSGERLGGSPGNGVP